MDISLTTSILAIDPGSRNLGYAIIDQSGPDHFKARTYGVLRYSAKTEFCRRLTKIHSDVFGLILEHQPQWIAIEKAFVGESVTSAMKLGEARAAAIIAAGRLNRDIIEITPAEAKKAVTGNGRATKQQVQAIVSSVFAIPADTAFDACDALCVGLACLYRRETGQALGLNKSKSKSRSKKRRKGGGKWTLEEITRLGLEYRDAH